jgi:23S rRNA pseudouridine2605 synthase
LTAEQLEAARAERMRQNGHGAITIEDVRTWIEETGLCIFLPRSAQAGQSAQPGSTAPTATPTFVEAVAGQRTTEPTLELISTAESLLVRLEAEGVAVRLNLAGQPGDQPDYVVAGWVLPYIYALRGDRDWRRSPQLTGSRQVSQLAVLAAKQLDSANMTAAQIRDALGREVTETAVLRALHELWKQLRIIPVVPEVGVPALWQPLRQRFQKAIAEGASTSQVTAISVLASIYLQAVIAASMEDVEMFLSPLTSRSKIREVVRGLAATRQVHTTTMGHSPMFYVAGTLPEFPAVPSYQISSSLPSYRGSSYLASYLGHDHDHDDTPTYSRRVPSQDAVRESLPEPVAEPVEVSAGHISPAAAHHNGSNSEAFHLHDKSGAESSPRHVAANAHAAKSHSASHSSGKLPSSGKSAPPRPRTARTSSAAHPRERNRTGLGSGDARSGAANDRRRAPAPRGTSATGGGARNAAGPARPARSGSFGTGSHTAKPAHATKNGHANGHARNGNGSHAENGNGKNAVHGSNGSKATHSPTNSSWGARPPAKNGAANGAKGSAGARPASRVSGKTESRPGNRNAGSNGTGPNSRTASTYKAGAKPGTRSGVGAGARPASGQRASEGASRKPAASASKRYSFSGQAKQAPKPVVKAASGRPSRPVSKAGAAAATKSHAKPAHAAQSKRRG